ncbi:sodium-dependent phosphate transport protein 2B-like [Physella acuta]|uniref:sodium-dependent phosphate transport protein 2B-like n=1 Tax=Physella acuta TaxID=109671 RepID=UPI0027DD52DD|nr:sodium-dependent phosphate transport protein 2B-like [Physella acuta]
MTLKQKCRMVAIVCIKLISFLGFLYFFIISLGLLEAAFQLLGGKTAGAAFSSGVLSNPLAGLMIGVLATVLVQSSSTSTSIVVTMVGSSIIPVDKAVYIVMGANIGTSVTNTIVSLAQANKRNEFRRAFSGATVHDMFNWLTVIVLLPLEVAVGYLHWLSGLVVDALGVEGNQDQAPDMLKAVTQPFIHAIVEINKTVIRDVAQNSSASPGDVLLRWCRTERREVNRTFHHTGTRLVNCKDLHVTSPLWEPCQRTNHDPDGDPRNVTVPMEWVTFGLVNETKNVERCYNLFAQTDLPDAAVGAILLAVSLILLLAALCLIVHTLNSMLSGSVSRVIKKTINADFPKPFAYLTGYVAILVGCGMTMIVQSSSVFLSTLTPLVGLGIVSVDRMYPMTLGSNVGTTVTAILAALTQSGEKLRLALQIALCHLFFNVTGIVMFYPVPFLRWPVGLAKILGKTTARHRWFALFYILMMFLILPGFIFALSIAGWVYLGVIGGPILLVVLIIAVVNALQTRKPSLLPVKLRDWEFLPLWCHSLDPVDELIERACRCQSCQVLPRSSQDESNTGVEMEVKVTETAAGGKTKQGVTTCPGESTSGCKHDGCGHTADRKITGVVNCAYQHDSTAL